MLLFAWHLSIIALETISLRSTDVIALWDGLETFSCRALVVPVLYR